VSSAAPIGLADGCIRFAGVAVVALSVSTPCNRFLDDGKGLLAGFPLLLASDYTIPE